MPLRNNTQQILTDINARKTFFQFDLLKWANENYRHFPWRENRTPYRVLISESLLKRTTATAVLRVYEKFLCQYPTIEDLANAKIKNLEKILSTLGLQRQRSKLMLDMAKYLIQSGSEIPADQENLLKIPHVGDYSAAAILSFGYGIPAAILDSNVERILRRLFAPCSQKDVSHKVLTKIADVLLPLENHVCYNYGLLDLGAIVCRYKNPKCSQCPLNKHCDYWDVNQVQNVSSNSSSSEP